jgi:hypothetical protein
MRKRAFFDISRAANDSSTKLHVQHDVAAAAFDCRQPACDTTKQTSMADAGLYLPSKMYCWVQRQQRAVLGTEMLCPATQTRSAAKQQKRCIGTDLWFNYS